MVSTHMSQRMRLNACASMSQRVCLNSQRMCLNVCVETHKSDPPSSAWYEEEEEEYMHVTCHTHTLAHGG